MNLEEKLVMYGKAGLNVMFIGTMGVGKTTLARKVLEERLGLKFKYYSSSTMDPWAHLVGIPVPNEDKTSITFCRPKDLNDVEVIFFDELNRAHPRILNSVLEIIQFKSINGEKLPNLKMIWCAVNPPNGDYQVEDMDPALVDRFQIYIKMPATIDMEYFKTKMDEKIAKVLGEWWESDLSEEQKKVISPRRVELLGTLIQAKIPYKDAIPDGHLIPLKSLDERLECLTTKKVAIPKITKEFILNNEKELLDMMENNKSLGIKIKEKLKEFDGDELFQARNVLESLQKDWLVDIKGFRMPIFCLGLKKHFINKKINYKKDYPKITDIFNLENV